MSFPIQIATCKNRHDITYKNNKVTWDELVRKLSKPKVTYETYAQYKEMKKDLQDDIKDVGGFVGGYLKDGKRKKDTVLSRSLVALDLDFASYNFFDSFYMLQGYKALCYSTHKHSKKTPKYRLVIPLSRDITYDEYEPIARHLANKIGIDMFDDTTFQAERMMYFPSISVDGEYYFKESDGYIINPDTILGTYDNWKDVSSYSVSSRVNKRIANDIKKQQNPLEKDGFIGAFCKSYTITDVFEIFLPKVYKKGDNGRYTYIKGSSSNGVIVYNNMFCYSHHGTDKATMQLMNAFDIVRVHMFSHLDENAKDKTNTSKLPSFKKMIEFCKNDKKVVEFMAKEKLEKSFANTTKTSTKWLGSLSLNTKGEIQSTVDNILLILDNDKILKKCIGYNEFTENVVITKDVPWRKLDKNHKLNSLKDVDNSGFRHYLEKIYKITGAQKIQDAIDLYSYKNKFHPIRDYLDKLTWDKNERVDTLFIDYLGANDSELVRAQTRKALTACVTRTYEKGAKFDYVLTLVGEQGVGKSTILKKLGGDYYNESITLQNIDKDTVDGLRGSWIIEFGELTGLRKAETEAVKNFISRTTDEYRKAYARNTQSYARQCVFFGTTNEEEFLRDATGNRRWWVLKCDNNKAIKSVFKDLTKYEVSQIWAECVVNYKKGEKLYLDKTLEEKSKEVQEKFTEVSPLQGAIEEFLEIPILPNWSKLDVFERQQYFRNLNDLKYQSLEKVKRTKVCVQIIWVECFGRKIEDLKRQNSIEINRCLSQVKTLKKSDKKHRFSIYGVCRCFEFTAT